MGAPSPWATRRACLRPKPPTLCAGGESFRGVHEGTPLALALASDAIIAVFFAWAGVALARRPYSRETRRAGSMFALFWFGISATGISTIVLGALAAAHSPPGLVDAVDHVSLVFFAAALVGFTSYLSFIYRGDHRADRLIVGAYGALVLWSVASAVLVPATSYHFQAWRPIVDRPPSPFSPSPAIMALLLVVPTLAGTAAYASLVQRTSDPETRRRLALVSGALVAWLLGATIVSIPALGSSTTAQLAGRAVVLAAAVLLLRAYRPERPAEVASRADPQEARAARARRLAELI